MDVILLQILVISGPYRCENLHGLKMRTEGIRRGLEEDLCWIVPHVSRTTQPVKGLNWTEHSGTGGGPLLNRPSCLPDDPVGRGPELNIRGLEEDLCWIVPRVSPTTQPAKVLNIRGLEENLCWIVPHVCPTTQSVKVLNWISSKGAYEYVARFLNHKQKA